MGEEKKLWKRLSSVVLSRYEGFYSDWTLGGVTDRGGREYLLNLIFEELEKARREGYEEGVRIKGELSGETEHIKAHKEYLATSKQDTPEEWKDRLWGLKVDGDLFPEWTIKDLVGENIRRIITENIKQLLEERERKVVEKVHDWYWGLTEDDFEEELDKLNKQKK